MPFTYLLRYGPRRAALAASIVATCLALVPAFASAQGGSGDLAAHPGSLVRVPNAYRPQFRWWWPTDSVDPDELRSELRAMKAAGFGAVEQSLFANAQRWGSPTFRERTAVALREANRLGLRYDITLGPGWPMSSPGTEDLDREASVQTLHYGAVDLTGPTTYSGPGPIVRHRAERASD